MTTESKVFYTENGVINATPSQVEKFLGEYVQVWEVTLITGAGVKKLQPQYLRLGTSFSYRLAEQLSYLQTPEGAERNREAIRKQIKEINNGQH